MDLVAVNRALLPAAPFRGLVRFSNEPSVWIEGIVVAALDVDGMVFVGPARGARVIFPSGPRQGDAAGGVRSNTTLAVAQRLGFLLWDYFDFGHVQFLSLFLSRCYLQDTPKL